MTAPHTPHAHPHPEPYHRLFSLLRPDLRDIGVILIFSLLNGILLIAQPLAVDAVVNNIAFGGEQSVYVQALVIISLALFIFLVLMAVMRAAQYYVMEIIQRRLFVRMTADLAYRLPNASMTALERTLGPELINRFFEIVTIQKSSSLLLLEGVNLALATIIGLVVLAFYHPYLLAFALVLMTGLAVVVGLLGRHAVTTSIQESYSKHAVVGWLEQIAQFPVLFKGTGAAGLACRKADILACDYLDARRSHFRILLRQIAGLLALQALASGVLLTLGGILVLRGELTLGQLVAAELIVGAIVASVAKMGKHLEAWYDALAAVDKLGYLVDLPIEESTGTMVPNGTGPMEVRAVRLGFTYSAERPLLKDLSFHFPAGSRVAVVAAAGYGASTLLDILFALRPMQQGQVLLDGVDTRDWTLKALRHEVALVRGSDIVGGSIAENISLGREGIETDDIRRALSDVGLLETVLQYPEGLATLLAPGGRPLSSTERMRLMLARALIGKPRLLLLDECLEGLDLQVLAELEPCLFDRRNPWTLVLVTRDPELIRRCDQVLTLGECHPGRGSEMPQPPTP